MLRRLSAQHHPPPCIIKGCYYIVDVDKILCRWHRADLKANMVKWLYLTWEFYTDDPMNPALLAQHERAIAEANAALEQGEYRHAHVRC